MPTYTIYQLVDPLTNQPCYVGYTDDLERRRQDYRSGLPHSKALILWFLKLKDIKLEPLLIAIDTVEGTIEDARAREAYWIEKFIGNGISLFNVQKNSTRRRREQKTILFEVEQARWLEIQAATERRELSEIIHDALELYKKLQAKGR